MKKIDLSKEAVIASRSCFLSVAGFAAVLFGGLMYGGTINQALSAACLFCAAVLCLTLRADGAKLTYDTLEDVVDRADKSYKLLRLFLAFGVIRVVLPDSGPAADFTLVATQMLAAGSIFVAASDIDTWVPFGGKKDVPGFLLRDVLVTLGCIFTAFIALLLGLETMNAILSPDDLVFYSYVFTSCITFLLITLFSKNAPGLQTISQMYAFIYGLIGLFGDVVDMVNTLSNGSIFATSPLLAWLVAMFSGFSSGYAIAALLCELVAFLGEKAEKLADFIWGMVIDAILSGTKKYAEATTRIRRFGLFSVNFRIDNMKREFVNRCTTQDLVYFPKWPEWFGDTYSPFPDKGPTALMSCGPLFLLMRNIFFIFHNFDEYLSPIFLVFNSFSQLIVLFSFLECGIINPS